MGRKVLSSLLMPLIVFIASNVIAGELKQGDKVKIITPETVAHLCPHPSCGPNQHITRIPHGTVLTVEGIMSVKTGPLPPVRWFEVTYQGEKGWISIFDTDAQ